MSEKRSIVIEEYLLLLYQLRGAGERLKAGYPSTAPQEQCTDRTRYPAAYAAR